MEPPQSTTFKITHGGVDRSCTILGTKPVPGKKYEPHGSLSTCGQHVSNYPFFQKHGETHEMMFIRVIKNTFSGRLILSISGYNNTANVNPRGKCT
jgi:hypothetical protein